MGFFGLASLTFHFGAFAIISIRVILDRGNPTHDNQKLAVAAVLASVGRRTVEQLAGIPHISDEALL